MKVSNKDCKLSVVALLVLSDLSATNIFALKDSGSE